MRNQTSQAWHRLALVEFRKAMNESGFKLNLFSPLSTLPDRGRSGYAQYKNMRIRIEVK
jgi:hypothetical protein